MNGSQPGPVTSRKWIAEMTDTTYTVDLSTKALVLCKDHSKSKTPGKWAKRRKQDRPANRRLDAIEETCEKEIFKTMEKAKWAVERADRARSRAQVYGHQTRRREVRVYECFKHSTRVFHLTSQDVESYAAKFEAGARGELNRAA
jgi:hypothetical protein